MNISKIAQKIIKEQDFLNTLVQSVTKIYDECFKLQKNEKVLVVTDRFRMNIGKIFYDIARNRTKITVLTTIEINDNRPDEYLEKIIENFDVILLVGDISYLKLRQKVIKLGKRAATFPEITENILIKMASLDLNELQKNSEKLAKKLDVTKVIRITTEAGTDVEIHKENQKVLQNNGNLTTPGSYQNIPPGEVYISPIEHKTNGTIVIDGSFPLCGLMKSSLKMEIKNGYVIGFETADHNLAEQLDSEFTKYGKDAANIAELGIGISKVAKMVGITLEDEKSLNTVHIAIGANAFFGGTVNIPIHFDGVILNPTIYLDNKKLN
jgi:leucyl aminopeptidase (aminopeptidase T)